MFLRHRNKPLPLKKLDAIITRLPEYYPHLEDLKKRASQLQKGYNGERKLDYHLKSLPNKFHVLSDVTLMMADQPVQIDSLIIADDAIFIIEVKSLAGTVTFNTNLRHCIQDNQEKLAGYKYPITQAERTKFHLQKWLEYGGLAGMPIHYFIAFSERSTLMQVEGDEQFIGKVVTYVDDIPLRIMELANRGITNPPLKHRITKNILAEVTDFDIDILKKYKINRKLIQNGVHCPECRQLRMGWENRKWICPHCHHHNKKAHHQALEDYTLLIEPTITNRNCRAFLQVSSRHITHRLLSNSGLKLIKGTKCWREI